MRATTGCGDEPAAAEREAPGRQREPRVGFTFEGDLDDVSMDAAQALARVARVLVAHSDQHDGEAVAVGVTRLGSRLRLTWTDPECSKACLGRATDLSELESPPASATGRVRLVLEDSPGGLHLNWTIVPSATPTAGRNRITIAGRRSRTLRPWRSWQVPVAKETTQGREGGDHR